MKWIVKQEESESKLLKVLKTKFDTFSSKQLKRWIEENRCKVNGVTERFATALVYEGDEIFFDLPKEETKLESLTHFVKERILYEDEDLFIYNKPSNVLSEAFKTSYFLIHRLDRETTGVLMFAKNVKMKNEMIELFRKHLVRKTYLALTEGIPSKNAGIIENYLGKKYSNEDRPIWGSQSKDKGLYAYTEWMVEKKSSGISLIKCHPKTGRTHQIRVHLSEMKLPILGDYQYYRSFKCHYKPKRCLLHASKVEFIHPVKKRKLSIEAELPEDFKEAMQELL